MAGLNARGLKDATRSRRGRANRNGLLVAIVGALWVVLCLARAIQAVRAGAPQAVFLTILVEGLAPVFAAVIAAWLLECLQSPATEGARGRQAEAAESTTRVILELEQDADRLKSILSGLPERRDAGRHASEVLRTAALADARARDLDATDPAARDEAIHVAARFTSAFEGLLASLKLGDSEDLIRILLSSDPGRLYLRLAARTGRLPSRT